MIQTHSKKTSGFTLVEMMISIAIITVILSGVLQFYLTALRQQLMAHEIQDRALQRELIITELQTSLHNAGYFGCRGFRGYFKAFEINPRPLPRSILQRTAKGSDVLKLMYLDPYIKPPSWVVSCYSQLEENQSLNGVLITEYWYIRKDKLALYRQIRAKAERIADHIESLKALPGLHEIQISLNWESPKQQEAYWFALPNLT